MRTPRSSYLKSFSTWMFPNREALIRRRLRLFASILSPLLLLLAAIHWRWFPEGSVFRVFYAIHDNVWLSFEGEFVTATYPASLIFWWPFWVFVLAATFSILTAISVRRFWHARLAREFLKYPQQGTWLLTASCFCYSISFHRLKPHFLMRMINEARENAFEEYLRGDSIDLSLLNWLTRLHTGFLAADFASTVERLQAIRIWMLTTALADLPEWSSEQIKEILRPLSDGSFVENTQSSEQDDETDVSHLPFLHPRRLAENYNRLLVLRSDSNSLTGGSRLENIHRQIEEMDQRVLLENEIRTSLERQRFDESQQEILEERVETILDKILPLADPTSPLVRELAFLSELWVVGFAKAAREPDFLFIRLAQMEELRFVADMIGTSPRLQGFLQWQPDPLLYRAASTLEELRLKQHQDLWSDDALKDTKVLVPGDRELTELEIHTWSHASGPDLDQPRQS